MLSRVYKESQVFLAFLRDQDRLALQVEKEKEIYHYKGKQGSKWKNQPHVKKSVKG